MPVIKAVLFDLDDTLWPIVPVIERAENLLYDWLHRHAPAVTREVTIESMRARRQALIATDPAYQLNLRVLRRAVLREAFIDTGQDPALVEQAMEVFSRARNEVTPFEDVLPTLSGLQGRVAVGSVSNGVADLHAIGIAHFFQTSVAAHRLGCAKPDAAIFLAACESLKIAPHEAVYVGDDPVLDVEGAQKAGLHGAWINRAGLESAQTFPAHVRPDAIFSTLYELDGWLSRRT